VVAIDTSGSKLWETPLPQAVGLTVIDRITVGASEAYVTVRSVPDASGSMDVDVIAISLT
jgi:hypothetical protein